MERFELDRDSRADLYVDTDQPVFALIALNPDQTAPAMGHRTLQAAASSGHAVPIAEGIDVPANIRFCIGDLNFDEAEEWVVRHSWAIHVGEGGVAVCGGVELLELGEMPDNDEDGANVLVCDLQPGTYRVIVYGLVPRDEAIESIDERLSEDEDMTEFFVRTRAGETPPSWLQLYAMDHIDGEAALRTEALENDELVYIHYIVQLIPSSVVPPTRWPAGGIDALRDFRMPSFCPLGLRSPKFESELLDEEPPADPMAGMPAGMNPMAMLGGMNPLEMIQSMSSTDEGKAMLQQAAEMAKNMFQGGGMGESFGASQEQMDAGFDMMMKMIGGEGRSEAPAPEEPPSSEGDADERGTDEPDLSPGDE